jgi:hypothetical protein
MLSLTNKNFQLLPEVKKKKEEEQKKLAFKKRQENAKLLDQVFIKLNLIIFYFSV